MTSIFSKPQVPQAPTPIPPPTMPDPMSPDALAARRKALTAAGQNGRTSTTLTAPGAAAGATLAGGAVPVGTKLGG